MRTLTPRWFWTRYSPVKTETTPIDGLFTGVWFQILIEYWPDGPMTVVVLLTWWRTGDLTHCRPDCCYCIIGPLLLLFGNDDNVYLLTDYSARAAAPILTIPFVTTPIILQTPVDGPSTWYCRKIKLLLRPQIYYSRRFYCAPYSITQRADWYWILLTIVFAFDPRRMYLDYNRLLIPDDLCWWPQTYFHCWWPYLWPSPAYWRRPVYDIIEPEPPGWYSRTYVAPRALIRWFISIMACLAILAVLLFDGLMDGVGDHSPASTLLFPSSDIVDYDVDWTPQLLFNNGHYYCCSVHYYLYRPNDQFLMIVDLLMPHIDCTDLIRQWTGPGNIVGLLLFPLWQ